MKGISKTEVWLSIVVVIGMGAIHLISAPGEFQEAPYLGTLFVLHSLGAVVAAIGIYRGAKLWGWELGLLLAAGAIVGYVISRTIGLPGMEIEEWINPLGILSLVLEALFIVLFIRSRSLQPVAAK